MAVVIGSPLADVPGIALQLTVIGTAVAGIPLKVIYLRQQI